MADDDKKTKPAETLLTPPDKPVDSELEARMLGERAKVSPPVAPPRPIRQKPEPFATVNEEKEVAVKVVHSTIVFRPHEKLYSQRLFDLAVQSGIKLRNIRKDPKK